MAEITGRKSRVEWDPAGRPFEVDRAKDLKCPQKQVCVCACVCQREKQGGGGRHHHACASLRL